MVSSTRQTERRRNMRERSQGRSRKASEARGSTPKFPVHPEGSASKPDAKKKAPQG